KQITELLMNDQGNWQRMKEKFRKARIRDYKLKTKVLDELRAAGLRISRRSKKIKQAVHDKKENFRLDHHDSNEYYNDKTMDGAQKSIIHNSMKVNEQDYEEEEDLDLPDEADDFEQIDDIHGICDQVVWNVMKNSSQVYVLTTFLRDKKIVCSLSDTDPNVKYNHVCEYVLDFCFANDVCGKHGYCVNSPSGFKCSCSFLYGGILCEKISRQGQQILLTFGSIIILYGLSLRPIQWFLWLLFKQIIILPRTPAPLLNPKKLDPTLSFIGAELAVRFAYDSIYVRCKKKENIWLSPITPCEENHGFAAYVSYLHMEVAHTHPVMLAFCYSLYDDILERRPKCFDDDECCISPAELDDEYYELKNIQTSKDIPLVLNRMSRRASDNNIIRKNIDNESDEENIEQKHHIQTTKTKINMTPPTHPPKKDCTSSSSMKKKHKEREIKENTKKLPSTVNLEDDESEEEAKQSDSNIYTAYSTRNHLLNLTEVSENEQRLRKKHARFRWYLAYTMINNCQLFDWRKDLKRRRTQMHAQRNNSLIEEEYPTEIPISRQITMEIDDYPQSPAERYINIRSSILNKTVAQELHAHYTPLASSALPYNRSEAQVPLNIGSNASLDFSNQLTIDYPTAIASGISDSATLHTQSNFTQQMQRCHQKAARKMHKKRSHCHVYGPSSQEPMIPAFSKATMITPQRLNVTSEERVVPPMTAAGKQLPSNSSLQFPCSSEQMSSVPSSAVSDNQVRNVNENLRKKRATKRTSPSQYQTGANESGLQQPIPAPRMDIIQDDSEMAAKNKN
ncbi:unnamed protein product, partial [Rotaria sp. Silwood2]